MDYGPCQCLHQIAIANTSVRHTPSHCHRPLVFRAGHRLPFLLSFKSPEYGGGEDVFTLA